MTYKDDAKESRSARVSKYADGGEIGVGEKIARYVSGGRDFGHRVFYNATRGSSPMAMGEVLRGETTPEKELTSRRRSNMIDAESISDSVPRKQE